MIIREQNCQTSAQLVQCQQHMKAASLDYTLKELNSKLKWHLIPYHTFLQH